MTDQKRVRLGITARKNKVKRRRTAALGGIILLLAAVGACIVLYMIARSATGFVGGFLGLNEDAAYFDSYLEPVVMFDPSAFGDPAQAKPQWKIETAIWAALDVNEQNGVYSNTADGREIMPLKDVEFYYKKYFGNAARLTYMSVTDKGFTYAYDKKGRCYYIPLYAVTDYSIPKVTKIARGFGTVTLTVQYIPGKNLGEDSSGSAAQPSPTKTMKIVLSGGHGGYSLKSIQPTESARP